MSTTLRPTQMFNPNWLDTIQTLTEEDLETGLFFDRQDPNISIRYIGGAYYGEFWVSVYAVFSQADIRYFKVQKL